MKVLIYPKDPNPYQELLYKGIHLKENVQIHYLENPTNSLTVGLLLLYFQVIIYRIKGYNIFHLHWTYTFSLPYLNIKFSKFLMSLYFIAFILLIKLLRYKIIWTVHNLLPGQERFFNETFIRKFLAYFCDSKIVHSNSTIIEMEKLSFNCENVYVIPIGNYIDVYENKITRNEAREYLNINKNDFVFLFFGRIVPYKGLENLLDAFYIISSKVSNVKLVIAGQDDKMYFKKIFKLYQNKLKNKVRIDNYFIANDKVQYYFNSSNVAVYPFTQITTSSSVILSFSFKIPVICPKIGNLQDLPDDTGFFYNVGNTNGLLNSMLNAIKSESYLISMGKKSSAYIENISWDMISNKTYEVYKEILKK